MDSKLISEIHPPPLWGSADGIELAQVMINISKWEDLNSIKLFLHLFKNLDNIFKEMKFAESEGYRNVNKMTNDAKGWFAMRVWDFVGEIIENKNLDFNPQNPERVTMRESKVATELVVKDLGI